MQPKPVDTLGTLLSESIASSKCYGAHFYRASHEKAVYPSVSPTIKRVNYEKK